MAGLNLGSVHLIGGLGFDTTYALPCLSFSSSSEHCCWQASPPIALRKPQQIIYQKE